MKSLGRRLGLYSTERLRGVKSKLARKPFSEVRYPGPARSGRRPKRALDVVKASDEFDGVQVITRS